MFGNKPPTQPPASGTPAPESGEAPQLPAVIKQSEAPVAPQHSRELVDSRSESSATAKLREANLGASYVDVKLETPEFKKAKLDLLDKLIQQIDFISLNQFKDEVQRKKILEVCDKIFTEIAVPLNSGQIATLKNQALDELFGFGPIEPLLKDPDISDIMINGHKQIYIEKRGKILLTDVTFLSEQHLLTIIQRIVSRVGRRVDEASPMVDARMPDGSRFNAIIPPLALNGSLVSIRKFKQNKMPLSTYVQYGSMSPQMVKFLEICGNIGLNMIVSGGTGSGKTTLLNALSGTINNDERVITIEDAAELQLQQPHVLRLETRPASMEGRGEINQRQLVKNALRMRPDRIILGEIRGDEVIDVLSAMNTGHDGSMATIHANNPRDCILRIENLVGMSGIKIEGRSLKQQIASAIQIIIQVERMRDGNRRITSIEEIVGVEGEIISTQTLFTYKIKGTKPTGEIDGEFINTGIRPRMFARAQHYSREQEVLECFTVGV